MLASSSSTLSRVRNYQSYSILMPLPLHLGYLIPHGTLPSRRRQLPRLHHLITLLGKHMFWVFKVILVASAAWGCSKRKQEFLDQEAEGSDRDNGECEREGNFTGHVTHSCDLDKDLANLDNKNQAVMGFGCIALSTGHKERVVLARAVYSRPKPALLDDPPRSVDNRTGKMVLRRVFARQTMLLRQWGTTVILVTRTPGFFLLSWTYLSL